MMPKFLAGAVGGNVDVITDVDMALRGIHLEKEETKCSLAHSKDVYEMFMMMFMRTPREDVKTAVD